MVADGKGEASLPALEFDRLMEWLWRAAARAALAAKPQEGLRLNDLPMGIRGVIHIRDTP